jgi:hypothetical protein
MDGKPTVLRLLDELERRLQHEDRAELAINAAAIRHMIVEGWPDPPTPWMGWPGGRGVDASVRDR